LNPPHGFYRACTFAFTRAPAIVGNVEHPVNSNWQPRLYVGTKEKRVLIAVLATAVLWSTGLFIANENEITKEYLTVLADFMHADA